jgi:hypothetical protein
MQKEYDGEVYVVTRSMGKRLEVFCVFDTESEAKSFVDNSNEIDMDYTYDWERFDIE